MQKNKKLLQFEFRFRLRMKFLVFIINFVALASSVKSVFPDPDQEIRCLEVYLKSKGLIDNVEVARRVFNAQLEGCNKIRNFSKDKMIRDLLKSYNISKTMECGQKLRNKLDDLLLIRLMNARKENFSYRYYYYEEKRRISSRQEFEIGAILFQCMDEEKSLKIAEVRANPQNFVENELKFFNTNTEERFCLRKYMISKKLIKSEDVDLKEESEPFICPVDCQKQMKNIKVKFRLDNMGILLSLSEKKCWIEVHENFFDSIMSFFFIKKKFKELKYDQQSQIALEFLKLRNLWIKNLYECLKSGSI